MPLFDTVHSYNTACSCIYLYLFRSRLVQRQAALKCVCVSKMYWWHNRSLKGALYDKKSSSTGSVFIRHWGQLGRASADVFSCCSQSSNKNIFVINALKTWVWCLSSFESTIIVQKQHLNRSGIDYLVLFKSMWDPEAVLDSRSTSSKLQISSKIILVTLIALFR